jgi:hypothetical protein
VSPVEDFTSMFSNFTFSNVGMLFSDSVFDDFNRLLPIDISQTLYILLVYRLLLATYLVSYIKSPLYSFFVNLLSDSGKNLLYSNFDPFIFSQSLLELFIISSLSNKM